MRLRQIQNFVAVVEMGSIRAAARELRVSQPAITKSVRSLEAELHVQLVQRTPQGVVPTPAGRLFFARARVAHAELLKAEEELTQADNDGGGTVAFGVGPVGAVLIARRMLASPLARECLDEIAVAERPPMLTIGLFMRTDPPLTQLAAAMAKAVTGAAQTLARST